VLNATITIVPAILDIVVKVLANVTTTVGALLDGILKVALVVCVNL
jgi:hypothetical protein